jgi:hypothetical protein
MGKLNQDELEGALLSTKGRSRGERAALNLLFGTLGQKVIHPRAPWLQVTDIGLLLDVPALVDQVGPLSSGERRIVSIAAALADPSYPVALGDALWGLDDHFAASVVAAVAYVAEVDVEFL